ncbi:MAG: hypothetical protein NC347_05495 [Clostridium sp.]|nr:hypothetical protein [Clostridium sp.]
MDHRLEIHAGNDVLHISRFLFATEIYDTWEEFYDFFGYDIAPIAETDDDNYICLYYRENTKKPSIIYWNYELALENREEGIFFLYHDMNEFEAKLLKNRRI